MICSECRKIFISAGRGTDICMECAEVEEQDFNRVKDYIAEHPNASIIRVVSDTEIPLSRVQRLLQRGRLHTDV